MTYFHALASIYVEDQLGILKESQAEIPDKIPGTNMTHKAEESPDIKED